LRGGCERLDSNRIVIAVPAGSLPALIFHFAFVEAHCTFAECN
jgi:hypothetical protein